MFITFFIITYGTSFHRLHRVKKVIQQIVLMMDRMTSTKLALCGQRRCTPFRGQVVPADTESISRATNLLMNDFKYKKIPVK